MESKKTVSKSLFWAFLDQFSSKGISIIASIVLARILTPNDFGLISLIYIFTAIAQELADGGLGASLIRTKQTSYKDYSTIFFTNVFVAVFLYSICYLIAPFIANFYNLPQLTSLVRVYCLIFVINSFSSIHLFILIKKMEFRKIMLLNLPAILLASSIAIFMASKGYGVWSIVAMQLLSQALYALFLWINQNHIRLYFSIIILKRHYNFGLKIMATALLSSGFKNITNSIVGKFYSITDLGYFDRSKTLSSYPNTVFVGILSKVFYPLFSSIQSDDELIDGYKKVIKISFYCSFFTMSLLAVVAPSLIEVILDKQWLPAVPYFQLLCLAAILSPVNVFNLNIFKVKGFSTSILKIEILNVTISIIALLIGLNFTILGLIFCLLIAEVLIFFHNSLKAQKINKYSSFQQVKDFLPTITIGLLSYFLVECFFCIAPISNAFLKFIVQSFLYAFVFIFLSFIFNNYSFNYLLSILKTKINKQ